MKKIRVIFLGRFIFGLICLACAENSSDTNEVIPMGEPLISPDTEHETVASSAPPKPNGPVHVNATESAGSAHHSLQERSGIDTDETDAKQRHPGCRKRHLQRRRRSHCPQSIIDTYNWTINDAGMASNEM